MDILKNIDHEKTIAYIKDKWLVILIGVGVAIFLWVFPNNGANVKDAVTTFRDMSHWFAPIPLR
jgi:hypothetical protein